MTKYCFVCVNLHSLQQSKHEDVFSICRRCCLTPEDCSFATLSADVRGFGRASSSPSSSVGGEEGGDLDDNDGDDESKQAYERERERDTSASRERWTREWNRAIGLGDQDDGRDHDNDHDHHGYGNGRHRQSRRQEDAGGPAASPATAATSPRGRRANSGRAGWVDDDSGGLAAATAAAGGGGGARRRTAPSTGGDTGHQDVPDGRGFRDFGDNGHARGFAEHERVVEEDESGYGGSSSDGFYESGEEGGHVDRSGEVNGTGGREDDGRRNQGEGEDENSLQTTTGSEVGVGCHGVGFVAGSQVWCRPSRQSLQACNLAG